MWTGFVAEFGAARSVGVSYQPHLERPQEGRKVGGSDKECPHVP
jgi:hypothetical protein